MCTAGEIRCYNVRDRCCIVTLSLKEDQLNYHLIAIDTALICILLPLAIEAS